LIDEPRGDGLSIRGFAARREEGGGGQEKKGQGVALAPGRVGSREIGLRKIEEPLECHTLISNPAFDEEFSVILE
jgi:hypothetical protein